MSQWQRKDLVEVTGVLAVVISLIFVGMELAQNTAAVRTQTGQSVQIDLRDQLDFSQIEAQVSTKSPDERTAAEALMRRQYFFRAMRSYENQWYHFSEGYLDEDLFRGYQQHLRITLGLEDYLERWNARKKMGFFHPGFVEYVDNFLKENPPISQKELAIPDRD